MTACVAPLGFSQRLLNKFAKEQLCDGLSEKAARGIELAADRGVLRAVQGRDGSLPALRIALVQPGFHLADRLGGE